MTAGANNVIAIRFAINGTTIADTEQRTTANSGGRAESMTTLGIALMNPGQYIEIFVANLSSTTSVIVTDMQVTVTATAG